MKAASQFDFVPYRVNLTPFAGLLSDGQPHTISLSVFNDDSYFSAAASLLLYLDPHSRHVSGRLLQDTLTAPSPVVTGDLQGTSTVTGAIGVSQKRKYSIAGYVDTSHGRVTTSFSQEQSFTGTQAINFDTVNGSVIAQKTSVQNSVNSFTRSFSREGSRVVAETFSFPITVDFVAPVSNSQFGFTVATTQNYRASKLVLRNGRVEDFNSVSNSATASDVNPASSSQHYTSFDLSSRPYNCEIASANNALTTIGPGCGR